MIVGNSTRDDACVWDLGDGRALISTTDFFMPIVDDPRTFGRVAATNAISDVYAMGGAPVVAISILGWPVKEIPLEVAREVVEGGREACLEAGCALAGGHSIENPEPVFGLAVTGIVDIANLKRNDTARAGDRLFLTKGLGVGILTTAEKKGTLREAERGLAAKAMTTLNRVGAALGRIAGVHALTDVTGFGLLGHLSEMCEGARVGAEIEFAKVPTLTDLAPYLEMGTVPGGTRRNWSAYARLVSELPDAQRDVLADPQTAGGLLVAVDPAAVDEVRAVLAEHEGALDAEIGRFVPAAEGQPLIRVV